MDVKPLWIKYEILYLSDLKQFMSHGNLHILKLNLSSFIRIIFKSQSIKYKIQKGYIYLLTVVILIVGNMF